MVKITDHHFFVTGTTYRCIDSSLTGHPFIKGENYVCVKPCLDGETYAILKGPLNEEYQSGQANKVHITPDGIEISGWCDNFAFLDDSDDKPCPHKIIEVERFVKASKPNKVRICIHCGERP